jgi:hypothetical protein
MNGKSLIWIGMAVGSSVGGALPMLWGDGVFSVSSIVLTAVGGVAGIWLGFRLSRW